MPKQKNTAKLRRLAKRQDARNEREWELTQHHLTASPANTNPLCLPGLVPNQPPRLKSTEFETSGRKVLGELPQPTQLRASVVGKTERPPLIRLLRPPYLTTDDGSCGTGPRKQTLPESFSQPPRQGATIGSPTKTPRTPTVERAIPARLPIRFDKYPKHRIRSVVCIPNAPLPHHRRRV